MAGRARDLALAWQVMAGASSAPEPVNLGRLSIGVLRGHFSRNADPAVLEMVRQAAVRLEASSASVLPIDGEGIEDALGVWMDLCWSEFAAEHALVGDRVDELLLPETARAFRHGASLGPERREMARARALRIREWFDARMEDVDLLLAPATPYAAPPADEDEIEVEPGVVLKPSEGATSLFTRPVNLSGLPALAFPLGRTSEGLPAGAQLLARRGADELLVGLATTLEAEGFVAELPPLSRDP
jgi:aspartyl-tRNA(Asn)/glutamyl-tRNA(Gln) amidotransferase subunit A